MNASILILSSSSRHFPLDIQTVFTAGGLTSQRMPELADFISSPLRQKPFLAVLEIGALEDIDRALLAYEWTETVQPMAPARYLLLIGSRHISLGDRASRFRGVEIAQLPLPSRNILFKTDLQLKLLKSAPPRNDRSEGFLPQETATRERVLVFKGPGPKEGGWKDAGEAPQGKIRWRWVSGKTLEAVPELQWSVESHAAPAFDEAQSVWKVKEIDSDLFCHKGKEEIFSAAKSRKKEEAYRATTEADTKEESATIKVSATAPTAGTSKKPEGSGWPETEASPAVENNPTSSQERKIAVELGASQAPSDLVAQVENQQKIQKPLSKNAPEQLLKTYLTASEPLVSQTGSAAPDVLSSLTKSPGITPQKETKSPGKSAPDLPGPQVAAPTRMHDLSPEDEILKISRERKAKAQRPDAFRSERDDPISSLGEQRKVAIEEMPQLPSSHPKKIEEESKKLNQESSSQPPLAKERKEVAHQANVAPPSIEKTLLASDASQSSKEKKESPPPVATTKLEQQTKTKAEEVVAAKQPVAHGTETHLPSFKEKEKRGQSSSTDTGDPLTKESNTPSKPEPTILEPKPMPKISSAPINERVGEQIVLASEPAAKSEKMTITATAREKSESIRVGGKVNVQEDNDPERYLKMRHFLMLTLEELQDKNSSWHPVEGYRIYLSAQDRYYGFPRPEALFPLWIYEGELAPEFIDRQKSWKFYDRLPNCHTSLATLPEPVLQYLGGLATEKVSGSSARSSAVPPSAVTSIPGFDLSNPIFVEKTKITTPQRRAWGEVIKQLIKKVFGV